MKTTSPAKKKQLPASPRQLPKARSAHAAQFAWLKPGARQVFLAGSFNAWNPMTLPMEHHRDGSWSLEIELPPGHHEYLFIVDGAWQHDPTAPACPNEFGGVNSVIEIAAPAEPPASHPGL